jgi:hypothetical protein
LHAIECTVAADADQPIDLQSSQSIDDLFDGDGVLMVYEITRRTDDRAASTTVKFRDRTKERIEPNMRHARIEKPAESFHDTDDFDLTRIGLNDGALDRRVQCRCVAASGQNSNAFQSSWLPTTVLFSANDKTMTVSKTFTNSNRHTKRKLALRTAVAWVPLVPRVARLLAEVGQKYWLAGVFLCVHLRHLCSSKKSRFTFYFVANRNGHA